MRLPGNFTIGVEVPHGVTSFLEVQYYEQQYFLSALSLEQAWYTELQNYVQLYQALGGGWQQ